MCPKKIEASFYPFVIAVINLSYLLSYQSGGILTFSLGITSDDFSSLWILIVIAAGFPLVTLFLLLIVPSSVEVNEQIEVYLKLQQVETNDIPGGLEGGDNKSNCTDSYVKVEE
eukprot:CAMPEP_0170568076 /NCGR_PEP_ID=MMETSP0211-20121228/80906_1 /TAXON_ID=311385 /ORGANISM="Pseudokeronopsis sp., Strain OXSARD2" /LENGTH=113 /DNA_ID=CAMNT_0010889751 /DNA_START=1358 /DNA_END=1696 /DNA_ORIENTATION=+